jgi:hypothetical protein
MDKKLAFRSLWDRGLRRYEGVNYEWLRFAKTKPKLGSFEGFQLL